MLNRLNKCLITYFASFTIIFSSKFFLYNCSSCYHRMDLENLDSGKEINDYNEFLNHYEDMKSLKNYNHMVMFDTY